MTSNNRVTKISKKNRIGRKFTVVTVAVLTMSTGVTLQPILAATITPNESTVTTQNSATNNSTMASNQTTTAQTEISPTSVNNVVASVANSSSPSSIATDVADPSLTSSISANLSSQTSHSQTVKSTQQASSTPTSKAAVTKAATNIASGTLGTCSWYITSDGTLHVGSGNLPASVANSTSNGTIGPWDAYKNDVKKIILDGKISAGVSAAWLFSNFRNATELDGLSNLDLSQTTDISHMFAELDVTSIDLTGLDTRNVTNMANTFTDMVNLTSLDISPLDTSKVTNMNGTFSSLNSLTSFDISTLDTHNVTDMGSMFVSMVSVTQLDVSTLDTSKVTNMQNMFGGEFMMTNLIGLSALDTGNVTNMSGMFRYGYSFKNLDLSRFNTANVTNMQNMFESNESLDTLDISNFDMSKVTSVKSLLKDTRSLKKLILGKNNFLSPTSSETAELGGYLTADNSANYTGSWINQSSRRVLSRDDLMNGYEGSTMSGTYVWEKIAKVIIKNTTLIAGPLTTWQPADNFNSATTGVATALSLSDLNISGIVDTTKPGTYQIVYTYPDSTGTATAEITVVPSKANLIVNPQIEVKADSSFNPSQGFISATDADGNAIAFNEITVTGLVDTTTPGMYKLTYSYTDRVGNVVSKDVQVKVAAKVTPVDPTLPDKPVVPELPDTKPGTKPNQLINNKHDLTQNQANDKNKLPQTNEQKSNRAIIIAGIILMLSSVLGFIISQRRNRRNN